MYASANILLQFIAISSENNCYQIIKHFMSIKFSIILNLHFLNKKYYFRSNKKENCLPGCLAVSTTLFDLRSKIPQEK